MATAIVEFTLPGYNGLTLDVTLYPYQSDTLSYTLTGVTEATNRLGTYSGTQVSPTPGPYQVRILEGPTTRGEGYVFLTDAAIVHTVQGSPADAFPATASGVGARTITVTVDDGVNPLENAVVTLTEGINDFTATTDALGQAVFNLDDATYVVAIVKSGYSFSGDTLVVTGDASVTYSMTLIVITPPSDPSLAFLIILCVDEKGAPEEGVKIKAHIETIPPGSEGLAFDKTIQEAISDVDGLATLTVVRLAEYHITRGKSSTVLEVTIPDEGTTEITSFIGKP